MEREIRQISLKTIKSDPGQPRKEFDKRSISELANSIKRNGLLQPISVRSNFNGGYIIIAGERRFRAAHSLGLEHIDCIVFQGNKNKAKEFQLLENIVRQDLNSIEVAEAYQSFLEKGYTLDEIADIVGKPKNIISWLLNILKTRPEIQAMIRKDQMSLVVGIALGKLTPNGQLKALGIMTSNQLSVQQCQQLCEKVYSEENQTELFPESKLSNEEMATRLKTKNAIERACKALEEINELERTSPGITAASMLERLDITKGQLSLMGKLINKLMRSLDSQRVRALC